MEKEETTPPVEPASVEVGDKYTINDLMEENKPLAELFVMIGIASLMSISISVGLLLKHVFETAGFVIVR